MYGLQFRFEIRQKDETKMKGWKVTKKTNKKKHKEILEKTKDPVTNQKDLDEEIYGDNSDLDLNKDPNFPKTPQND